MNLCDDNWSKGDLRVYEHWCGVRVSEEVVANVAPREWADVQEAINAYGAALPAPERTRRHALWEAVKEWRAFRVEFWQWISEKVRTGEPGWEERKAALLRTDEGAVLLADAMTNAIPEAIRKQVMDGLAADLAWTQFVIELDVVVMVHAHNGVKTYEVRKAA